jgi:hypothetical protein
VSRARRFSIVLAVALGAALLAGCWGPAGAGHGGSAGATPRPGAASPAGAPRLSWRPGQRIDAQVEARQANVATVGAQPVPTELSVRATQSLRVGAVRGGAATIEVGTTGWRWLENRSELRPGSPPGTHQIRVDHRGVVLAGEHWSLPGHPRPPGIDLFSAGLPDRQVTAGERWAAQWQRTGRDDLPLRYEVSSVASGVSGGLLTVDSHLEWGVSQVSLTSTGDQDRLQGSGRADVHSTFDTNRGQVRETSHTSTYETAEEASGGTVQTKGTFAATVRFAYR